MAADTRGPGGPLDLREHHGIETPEHVDVHLELAGAGSRTAAYLLDLAVWLAGLLLLMLGSSLLGGSGRRAGPGAAGAWIVALGVLVFAFSYLGYFALFEALNGGRTPGKQALGIRVVMDTGRLVTPTAAVVRNVVRLLDTVLPIGLLFIFIDRSHRRPGDMAAGTVVVRDRPADRLLQALPESSAPEPIETGPPLLSDEEFRVLDRFLARQADLDAAVQIRMAAELTRRFEGRLARRGADPDRYLTTVFAEEQRKRRGRFALRAQPGPGRTLPTAERFVARKRATWEAFHRVATSVEKVGVGALPAPEVPAFAARYREVAADLARARTYGVGASVIDYLERLVAAGHNALYRARGRRFPVAFYVFVDFPAAVVASWRFVLLGFLLFAVPALVGYRMIRDQPELTDQIVPPVMVSRAEQAAERQARGIGYAEAPGEDRPVIAATIISNNILVCLRSFVGGLTAGIFTVLVLVANGLMLGTGFAVFVNHDAGPYLLTFVAGHGVLELTAIFISAGAGFRLAKAIIAPGDRTRKDALVLEGAIAARMIGAVVVLLAVAGTIEGLLSTSDAAPGTKYAVSAATAVLLALYLASGWRWLRRAPGATAASAASGG